MHFWAILTQLFLKLCSCNGKDVEPYFVRDDHYNVYFNELWMTKLNLEPDVVRRGHEQCIFLKL